MRQRRDRQAESWNSTRAFLKEPQSYLGYDEQDREQDRRDLDRFGV
jgi:hypothetical protein